MVWINQPNLYRYHFAHLRIQAIQAYQTFLLQSPLRAQFAYEACLLSRERLVSNDVFDHFGWDREESRIFQQSSDITKMFQKLLFQRIVPNLSRIGLLTDSVREKFETF